MWACNALLVLTALHGSTTFGAVELLEPIVIGDELQRGLVQVATLPWRVTIIGLEVPSTELEH
jgi:hypothetical protein